MAVGVTVDGHRDILGLWVGGGGEGANSGSLRRLLQNAEVSPVASMAVVYENWSLSRDIVRCSVIGCSFFSRTCGSDFLRITSSWTTIELLDTSAVGRCRRVVPGTVDVLEIHGPDDWVQLCRRFPLEVIAQKRPGWYRTTGRDGRWVLPDRRAVAEVYGGVHLNVAGYLAAAVTSR